MDQFCITGCYRTVLHVIILTKRRGDNLRNTVFLTLIAGILTTGNMVFSKEVSVPKAQISSSEQVALIVNKERKKRRLKPLVGSSKLSRVASGHAVDMYNEGYFSHVSLDGRTMADRLHEGDVKYRAAGENIAWGQKTAEKVMQAWMKSPGHRKNILNPKFGKIGIARAGNVWVQNFSN